MSHISCRFPETRVIISVFPPITQLQFPWYCWLESLPLKANPAMPMVLLYPDQIQKPPSQDESGHLSDDLPLLSNSRKMGASCIPGNLSRLSPEKFISLSAFSPAPLTFSVSWARQSADKLSSHNLLSQTLRRPPIQGERWQ